MKTRVCGHTNTLETNTYNIEVITVGIKRMSDEDIDYDFVRRRQAKRATGADVAADGGSANKPGLMDTIKANMPSISMPSLGRNGSGKSDGISDSATVDSMSKEVANKVLSSTDQLQVFIAKLCANVMKKSDAGAAAVWGAYLAAYKGQETVAVATAPIDMLEVCEYESEDDSHLFAEETQQQPEAPAETPVE